MKKLIAYTAMSLDGKVADAQGGVGWLETIPHPEGADYGYGKFIQNIDTTIMGNTTYQQVLGFDVPFPYKDQKNFVFSRDQSLTSDENVTFITNDHVNWLMDLKQTEGKDIWLIGGGKLNTFALENGLLDEMIVHVMPYVVGEGVSIFGQKELMKHLKLSTHQVYESGVVELHYSL